MSDWLDDPPLDQTLFWRETFQHFNIAGTHYTLITGNCFPPNSVHFSFFLQMLKFNQFPHHETLNSNPLFSYFKASLFKNTLMTTAVRFKLSLSSASFRGPGCPHRLWQGAKASRGKEEDVLRRFRQLEASCFHAHLLWMDNLGHR